MGQNPIAEQAIKAVTDDRFTSQRGMCQRFARQVVQAVIGNEYEWFQQPTAREAGLAAQRRGFTVHGDPQPGDLLYRLDAIGRPGHVGIYVGDNRVAENSTTRIGRVSGAKGYRTLKQFGRYDLIVRFPVAWPEEADQLDAVEKLRRQAAYRQSMHACLGQIYSALATVLPGEAGHDALHALNRFNAELERAGCK